MPSAGGGTGAQCATCYVIPHDCPHTTYATRSVLLGSPLRDLLDRLPDAAEADRLREAAADLGRRLPAEGTDTLAVVSPGSTRPGVTPGAGGSGPLAELAELAELVSGAERIAAEQGLPVVEFGNVREEPAWAPLHRILRERGYVPVTTGADAVLDAPAEGLDAYFDGFRSHRRKVLRKERARFLDRNPRVEVLGADGLTPDLVELQLDRYRRYGHEADADAVRDRFRRAASIPGLRVLRADGEGGPLGFVAFYEDLPHRRLVPRLGAFSTDDRGSYFNLAYYELIAHAARGGGFRIHYGESTYGAKTARGCRLTRLVTYFRAADPHLHHALGAAAALRSDLEEREIAAAEGTYPAS
ncbi:hypothetical protein OHS33_01365 [Streptomyces sp. NBC_00536]|uniref:hypothetical protein n=1 Tax=Streptomyces sp. NBC_00536 TaxID=2975769 RepID=UPI002E806882|nr:hypothetical protein [Streptomyces sp. NBC_00536]WUC77112.1 hypothetical protein OHS33_01365 [Streptomyces sp. NBC_00536]